MRLSPCVFSIRPRTAELKLAVPPPLLSCRRVVYVADPNSPTTSDEATDVYIGRSEHAMWMRVVSSWLCIALYLWSLYAPVLLPDRFGDV